MRSNIVTAPRPGQRDRRRGLVVERRLAGGAGCTANGRIELVAEARANDVQGQIAAAPGRGSPCEEAWTGGTAGIAKVIMQVFEPCEPIGVKQSGLGSETGNPPELPGRGRGR